MRCANPSTTEHLHKNLRNGIHGVPTMLIEQMHLVSGGPPLEVFERPLREITAGVVG